MTTLRRDGLSINPRWGSVLDPIGSAESSKLAGVAR